MDYGGYPQPGFAPPPSTFGYTMGAAGYSPYQQEYMQAGGANIGMSALNFATGTMPLAGMFGLAAASTAGDILEQGGRTAFTRGIGTALSTMDPFSIPFRFGMRGMSVGSSIGRGLGLGMTLGRGSSMFLGAAGAMGGTAGLLSGVALAAAPVYAAYKGGQFALNNMYQGGMNYIQGQNLANQMAPSVAPTQSLAGGYSLSNTLQDISRSTGFGQDDIARAARELDAQRLFQTTKDMKEFKDKLGTAMKAVKEIASVTKTSIDDAVKMFGELRAQGFYNTADIQSQSALTQARASITGMGLNTTLAVGGMGTQMARQMGLKGSVGSDLANRNLTGVSLALRSGALSEAEVMEMGGVEQVGLSQTSAQMRFLSTARGRTMIAGMMGAGGKMDPDRVRKVLSGNMTLEDLVTQTAEGGNLRAAGTQAAKEAAAPYAGMAMVQMAMMQQRQIYGGTSPEGTVRMLGTMGLSTQEAQALIKTLAQLPEQMRKERVEQENQSNRRQAERLTKEGSISYQAGQYMRPAGEYFQGVGAAFVSGAQARYTDAMENLFGGRTYSVDATMLEAGMSNRGLSLQQTLGDTTGSLFGINPTDRLRRRSGSVAKTASQLGYTQAQAQELVRQNKLVNLGGGRTLELFSQGSLFGEDVYATKEDLMNVSEQRGLGASAIRFSDQAQAKLIELSMDKNARSLLTQERNLTYKLLEGVNAFSGGMVSVFGFEEKRAQQELKSSYETARRIGLIDSSVSIEQWARDPNRIAADTRAGAELGQLGADIGLNLGGGGGLGAVTLGNIQQNTKAAINKSLTVVGGQSKSLSERIYGGLKDAGNAMYGAELLPGVSIPGFSQNFGTRPLMVPSLLLSGFAESGAAIGNLTGGALGVTQEGNKALSMALQKGQGGVKSLYIRFMDMIRKENPTKADMLELKATYEKLVEAVGGPGSVAANEIDAMYSKARDKGASGSIYRETLNKSFSRDVEGRATGALSELQDQFQREAVQTNITALQKRGEEVAIGIKDEKLRNVVFDLLSKSRDANTVGEYLDTRKAGLAKVLEDMFASGGALSEEEVETYGKLAAGYGGMDFAKSVRGLVQNSASKSELKGKLGDLSEDEIKKLQSKDPKQILEVLLKKTTLGESFTEDLGEGTETVQGTEMEFKKANTQFVQEVKSFVTMMKNAGLVPGEDGGGVAITMMGVKVGQVGGTAPE